MWDRKGVQARSKSYWAVAKRCSAALMLLIVLGLGFLASDAAAHKALHSHGTDAGDDCAICLFASGHVNLADAPVSAPTIFSQEIAVVPLLVSPVLSRSDALLPPGRAPPVS